MDKKLLEMERYAIKHQVPIMQKEGIQFLIDCIKQNKVRSILEIGSAIGYSAIQMCLIDPSIRVVTIERDEERYKEAIKNIELCNLTNRITIYHADALEIEIEGKYDLIFIDAAKAQYIKFFEKYENNLNEHGIILSDNLKFHGFVDMNERIKNRNTRQLVQKIKKYIMYLKENESYDTTFYDIGDGIAISKKK